MVQPNKNQPDNETRIRNYKTLVHNVNRNEKAAKEKLAQQDAPSIPELAALFNNIAYTGGGIYFLESERNRWIQQIKTEVSHYGWEVIWGPDWHYPGYHWDSESDACMFIAKNPADGTLMVVIRGTNPYSMSSWLSQDFDTGTMVPIRDFAPGAPAGATVAKGTYNGTNILVNDLKDTVTGKRAGDFLASLPSKPKLLIVTGHSLGGTLTPVYFAYLNNLLNGGSNQAHTTLIPISFAGLTPGGSGFNGFLQQQLGGVYYFRFVNSLDIAPFCWWSKQGVLTIYDHNNGNGCGKVILKPTDIIDELFSGIGGWYQEIPNKIPLTGHCRQAYDLWETLALDQHHVSTYLYLMAGNKEARAAWEEKTV